jgi:cytoskeletal protein RodZ
MEKAGEILRTARMEKGISLCEAEAATKIRARYLEALEEGEYLKIPGRAYAMGFLRNYVRFLGLDAQMLIDRFKEEYPAEEDDCPGKETGVSVVGYALRKWSRLLLMQKNSKKVSY